MNKLLILLLAITAVGAAIFAYPDGFTAIMFGAVCAGVAALFINLNFQGEERKFLMMIFVSALILRIILATLTYVFELQSFFGGDAITYDIGGLNLYNTWFGYSQTVQSAYYSDYVAKASGSGWGMAYIVAGIYSIVGRNPFATQIFNCVLGAASACLTYVCAKKIFNNIRVAKLSALLVAVFPSLVVWSSQGLKDGIICFLLVLAMSTVLSLQKRFNYVDVIILLCSLSAIYTLRFYIFFAFAASIAGSFIIGAEKSASSIVRQFIILIVLTIGLMYFGVLNNAQRSVETYGNLQTLQNSRLDQAQSAQSGFGQDIDVSTPTGAIQALPIGLTYLLLAPFPWQISSFRQLITLPEVLAWWVLIPFMFFGIWYAIKNKFRNAIAVFIFTLLLTLSYAIFQGNVGTAYRMRAQMQIFYFIFVAVGLVLRKEKRENESLRKPARLRQQFR